MTGHSEQLNELATALAKAQAEIETVEADGVGHVGNETHGRAYRYATLARVWDAVRKPLSEHGLSLIQTCEPSNRGELRLTTTLLHQSGQWVSGTEIVPMPVATPQGYGSALTYARRYGLAAMVGVCVDDDDAAVASGLLPAEDHEQLPSHTSTQSGQVAPQPPSVVASQQPQASIPNKSAQSWDQVPYNQAKQGELKQFAHAYAKLRGIDSVTSDDIRRDLGITGKLVDHFGATPLGQVLNQLGREPRSGSVENAEASHKRRKAA